MSSKRTRRNMALTSTFGRNHSESKKTTKTSAALFQRKLQSKAKAATVNKRKAANGGRQMWGSNPSKSPKKSMVSTCNKIHIRSLNIIT